MAKKDLRAQMDAARAATAYIGAAQEAHDGRRGDEAPSRPAAKAPERSEDLLGEEDASRAKSVTPATSGKRSARQVKSAASDVTLPATVPDFFAETEMPAPLKDGEPSVAAASADGKAAIEKREPPAAEAKPKRPRKPRKKAAEAEEPAEGPASRMTAQVLVPMTAEQREHADLLAQVMKITRAEVMRQALDEYWDRHKTELQAAVMAYEELIRKLMK